MNDRIINLHGRTVRVSSRTSGAVLIAAAVFASGCGLVTGPFVCEYAWTTLDCVPPETAAALTSDDATHRALESVIDRAAAEVVAHPMLLARATVLYADLEATLAHHGGPPGTLTSQDIHGFLELVESIENATNDDSLRCSLESLRGAIDPAALVGLDGAAAAEMIVAAAARTLTSGRPDASMSLQPRDRGVAWEGDTVVVPAAAHAAGALGTRWRTDLVLTNQGAAEAQVTIALLERGQSNPTPQETAYVLDAGESLFVEDSLATAFSFDGAAALRITADVGTVAVTSRTYNRLAGASGRTFGQFLPALTTDDLIVSGDEGRIIQLAHNPSLDSGTRTNLILVNGGGSATEVDIELRTGDGTSLGSIEHTLRPWEYSQIDLVFEEVTQQTVENGSVVIRPTTSGGRVYAIASAVDNLTGDPIAIMAARRSPAIDSLFNETLTIPAAAHVMGLADTNWRTDLVIHGLTGGFNITQVQLLPRGQENTDPVTREVNLSDGVSLRYDDVIDTLFDTDGVGAIRLTAYGGAITASSRTYNLLGEGNSQGLDPGSTFGQYMGPVGFTRAITFGEQAWVPHLSHSPSLDSGARANLGLVNNSTRTIDIVVELFRGDGTRLGSVTKTLRQWENIQIDGVFAQVTSEPVAGGYAIVSTTHPAGSFHAYGSVVDNATGDPITIDALPIRRPDPLSGVLPSVNAMMEVFDLGLTARAVFDFVDTNDLGDFFDQLAAAAPERVTRTAGGARYDLGVSTVFMDRLRVGGKAELTTDLVGSGSSLTGSVLIELDSVHVDGLAPVVDALDLAIDLQRTAGNHVAGTVSVLSARKTTSLESLEGTIEFDTALCEQYPIGGSLTLTYGGRTYTITFDPGCTGRVSVAAPSIDHWRLRLVMGGCSTGNQPTEQIAHLISDGGRLAIDPGSSDPTRFGWRRWTIDGALNPSTTTVDFVQRTGSTGSAVARDGRFQGEYSPYSTDEFTYYTGTYSYTASEAGCEASFYEGRDDPDLIVGILESCDGPCVD
jgi:hypothetical protein